MKTSEDEQWLIATMRTAIQHQYKIALLAGWRVRIYDRDGMTKFTFYLDDFTDYVQETVVDLIFPYID